MFKPDPVDDTIVVSHVIVCFNCSLKMQHASFINMNDWLNHKKETGHRKNKHTIAITGEDINGDRIDYALTFSRNTNV